MEENQGHCSITRYLFNCLPQRRANDDQKYYVRDMFTKLMRVDKGKCMSDYEC